jgi:hypothetical protein
MTNWTGIDPSANERFERAQNIVYNDGTVATGGALLQTYIDRVVQFLTLRELGLLAVLDRKQGSGPAAYVNQRSSDGTLADWKTDASIADPTSIVGVFSQASFTYRTLMTRGTVSRKMQAIGQSYIDILAMEMAGKAEDFASVLEEGLVWGNYVAATAEPMGLVTLLLSLANLDKAIDAVKGSSNRQDLVIIGSFQGIRQVNAALQAQQRFVDETEIAAGFRVRTYDGIPLIVSDAIEDTTKVDVSTQVGSINGQIISRTGSGATFFMILNKRHVFLSELTPTTVLPLAKTTSSADSFDMYWDGAPVLANNYGMSMLTNVSADGNLNTSP